MTLAGRAATETQWRNFDRQWKWLLEKHGLNHFHTTDFRAGKREFGGWPEAKQTAFLDAAQRIVGRNTLFGFATVLSLEEYESSYRTEAPSKGVRIYGKYELSFLIVLLEVPRLIRRSFAKEPVKVNFVLEAGDPGSEGALAVFETGKKEAPPDLANILGTLTFAPKRQHAGLAAADLIAFSAFQAEQQNPSITYLGKRHTLRRANRNSTYRSPVYRLRISAAVMDEMRTKSMADIAARKRLRRAKGNS
jgi:hypothetical protein